LVQSISTEKIITATSNHPLKFTAEETEG